MQPLLDYKAASELLGLKVGTLYSLVHDQRIPHVRLGTRMVRFDPEQLAAWCKTAHVPARDRRGSR